MEKKDRTIVNSVVRASRILSCISKGFNGIVAISKDTSLSKGTTHRLLRSLIKGGMVIQDPVSEKYYLGPSILQWLTNITVSHQILTICALEEMHELMVKTKETVLLHIRIGPQRVCIEEVESYQHIKYINGKGLVAPLHIGAAGKILLSELPDQDIEVLFGRMELLSVTSNTITEKKLLLDEIHKVRRLGYATSFGERVAGSACVSVPVVNYSVPVALSVLGPDNRFTPDVLQKSIKDIKSAGRRISEKLAELV